MAFNASTAQNVNGYSSTATYINNNSLNRTNPYANSEGINAEQLYGVDTYEDRIPVSFSWHIATAGARFTATPIYGVTSASDYLRFTIYDESGNSASTRWISSAPSAAIDVTTTALNKSNDWKVYFATSKAGAKTEFSYMISDAEVLNNTTATITYANL